MTNCTLLEGKRSFLSRKPHNHQVAEPAIPVARAPLAFLEVKPKARYTSKKSTVQNLIELLVAAASLIFLAMT